jgi:hypothetical protein
LRSIEGAHQFVARRQQKISLNPVDSCPLLIRLGALFSLKDFVVKIAAC